ncbi:hypothetical protein NA57DRAFT_71684 [Rhizodiscina lignyota]|uniref:Large ribosomal subunit protein mL67 n=1 Tax=Rhizodiscina lignyota TaxID=1504668 RepID=A0A9P4IMV1_9PEZI|nr:hypothetical protein NA57DRAFT_71684 [Rhizodiscina lignyota]
MAPPAQPLKAIATNSAHPLNAVARAASKQLGEVIAGEQNKARRGRKGAGPAPKWAISPTQKKVRADIRRQAEQSSVLIRKKRIARHERKNLEEGGFKPGIHFDFRLSPSINVSELGHDQVVQAKIPPKNSARERNGNVVVRIKDMEYGRHIYIFNHLVTNQVVYSFTQELKESSLKQLTFVGKKSVSSHLRPDLWSCLAIVTFPTQYQGREAYRQLREFRMMHEYCWKKPEDDTPLPRKSLRIRLLQNQKANSVADLAAVLEIQSRKGEEQRKLWREHWEDEEIRVARLEQIAKGEGEMKLKPELEAKLKAREDEIAALRRQMEDQDENQRKLTNREIKRLETRQAMLRPSLEAPTESEIAKAKEQLARREAVESQVSSEAIKEAEQLTEGRSEEQRLFVQDMLRHKKFAEHLKNYRPLPKRGSERFRVLDELHPERLPVFWMEGVHIMWADGVDADYARSWPEEVAHEEMGYVYGRVSNPDRIRELWRGDHQLSRFEMLAAKKDKGQKLTPEEEEFMKNVQLDGEDSGQGEDDGKKKKDKPEETEKEKRRQQEEEKKSIWSRIGSLFSRSPRSQDSTNA